MCGVCLRSITLFYRYISDVLRTLVSSKDGPLYDRPFYGKRLTDPLTVELCFEEKGASYTVPETLCP